MKLSYNSIFFKIYCLFFAKNVGKDEYGNSYYTKKNLSRKNNYRERRFVLYKGIVEASKVPQEWNAWLHHATEPPPSNQKKFSWLNVIRISALTSKGLNKFSKTLNEVNSQLNNRIDTSDLNLYFRELWVAKPPHPFRGKRAKLKYVTQYDISPPSFSFNLSSRIPKNYYSFIENKLREEFGFKNVSLKIKYKT